MSHKQGPNAPAKSDCPCYDCASKVERVWWMVVCDECGNKRCPHASDHRYECSGSNEPGQTPVIAPEQALDATHSPEHAGPVFRDRGTIIANQQARIAELEAEVRELRLKHGPALFEEAMNAVLARAEAAEAELAALRGRIEALADDLDSRGEDGPSDSATDRQHRFGIRQAARMVRALAASETNGGKA